MKHFYVAILFFVFPISLLSQTKEVEKLNSQIKNTVFKKPDSAKVYLLRLLGKSSDLHDTVVAKTYSNLGITYTQLGILDSSEYYFNKGIEIAQGQALITARLYSNLSVTLRTASRYSESLEALKKSLALYRKAKFIDGEAIVYGEMASNYNYMLQPEKAIIYLKKAIAIFNKTGNDREVYIIKQKLGNFYFNNGNYVFAKDIFEELLPIFAKEKGLNYYYTLMNYGQCLMALEEYSSAEKALLETEAGLRRLENLEHRLLTTSLLGKLYGITNRSKEAISNLKEAYEGLYEINSPRFTEVAAEYLKVLNKVQDYKTALIVINSVKPVLNTRLKMNADNEILLLQNAIITYNAKKLFEESVPMYERVDFLKDSLNNANNVLKINELQEEYQNKLQREKNISLSKNNALLVENNTKQQNIIFLTLFTLALVSAIPFIIYYTNKNKIAIQKTAVENLEKSHIALQEKQELEHELFEEREKTLADKERELIAISLEMADLQNQVTELLDNRQNKEASNEIASQITNIFNQKNYWKHFKTKFVEVHPEFGQNLIQMFPMLSDNDIAFCSLLKLQLTNKEIASLMGISHQSVISKKYRIKRKMALQDDDVSFENLIRDL
ncbi:tetratricopeptide repeat protein [Aequorivita sp. CIP111184]|uniref:tetratricopeptide repeat protein n=1 Tax=Aequorivita sp. CIP111184 TaxID=2211356 RepID=UPI000DBBF2C7|nr:tetratricopeptide repeat protein [Aequorivita sp. CIP111184]SRX54802.1 hypothetical protein AEQU1_01820 [Aequorivita sp. CIP111184]